MIRRNVKKVLQRTGVLQRLARRTTPRIAILFYHGFRGADGYTSPQEVDGKFTPAGLFERQIRVCQSYGTVVPLHAAISDKPLPRNPIVLSFDDGYLNNWTVAFPLLKKYEVPVTIYLTTGFLDRKTFLWTDWLEHLLARSPGGILEARLGGESIRLDLRNLRARPMTCEALKARLKLESIEEIHRFLTSFQERLGIPYDWDVIPEQLQPLRWDMVRAMSEGGLVTFGAHTVGHPVLSRCDRDIQEREIRDSKQRIEEELGRACLDFAYPNGRLEDYTEETVEIIRGCGFKAAVTTERGFAHPSPSDPLRLPRWGAPGTEEDLAYLLAR